LPISTSHSIQLIDLPALTDTFENSVQSTMLTDIRHNPMCVCVLPLNCSSSSFLF
jgi:hypothetical protein